MSHLTLRHENTPACLGKSRDEVGMLLIKRHTQVMRFFRSGRYAHVASRLAIVLLLCVGALFSLLPTRLGVPTAPTTADSSQVDKGADGHPLDGSYLAVPPEEAEDVDEGPVNADLLSALFLLALSFRATFVWSLANGWWHRAFSASWASIGVGGASAPSRIDPSWACSGCRGLPLRPRGAPEQSQLGTPKGEGSKCPVDTSPRASC